ncbi:hypothetical protein GPEL0_01f5235 [Geoanaerobacter pelophilus]|uniref:Uncharacterized protein n=1 Tax=Geoanaerobacter pelophilus TaxID=60036 RepID=A0ABQ0MPM7_9BACT|nr:hypothetical protein [Geoanaerobacter pelophilus]GAW68757.1 hypothetical protein GPEL0_01f5235 [Geoanaerobacter pelophilus]
MTAITPSIKLFTSQGDDSITINNLILEYRGNNYQFHGGSNDIIHVFTESMALYVLTINRSNGTVGLSSYMSPQSDPINGIYLHTPGQIRERLGDKWDQIPARDVVETLINYLM